ncbi:hypothetical protein [Desulfovibrio cuneatus]|uniref:hypothetical protein n=1 Tax=Desulfovibrio cuneatus TaxID=159728 RepID=UPI00040994E2|nr:hypothetical protein [Desulfovibrio cuneatus]
MGWEHEAETIWQAQELYCVDRLSFARVAELTGVAASTLKRWSETYRWREKREEIAQAEADIRANKVLARSKTVKALLDTPRADLAFAVSALETLAMKEAEAARQGATMQAQAATASMPINTPAEAIAALRSGVEQKLAMLLTRPENIDLRGVQEVQKCLALIADMESKLPVEATAPAESKGITAEMHKMIEDVLSGKVEI